MAQMTKKTAGVADVAGTPYIGVTRARARVKTVIRECPATSATDKIASATEELASFLALDLGTTTGWALRTASCRILHGTADFRPGRYEGGGMRYLRFGKWLDQTLHITGGIDAVYFEEVRRHAGTDASHVYGGLLATLTAWCEAHGIPYQGVPVGTWKRHTCGKGNADKQAVIIAMRERGFDPSDDNEADAIAILLWSLETKGGVA